MDLPVIQGRGNAKDDEIGWTSGAMAFVIALLHYKLSEGAQSALFTFTDTTMGSVAHRLYFVCEKARWLGGSDEAGKKSILFGAHVRKVIKKRKDKVRRGVQIDGRLLARDDVRIYAGTDLVPVVSLRGLLATLESDFRNGESVALPPSAGFTLDAYLLGEQLSKESDSDEKISGDWTKSDVLTLLRYFYRFPEKVHPSWSVGPTVGRVGSPTFFLENYDAAGTALALLYGNSWFTGPAFYFKHSRAAACLLLNRVDIFQSIARFPNIGVDFKERKRELAATMNIIHRSRDETSRPMLFALLSYLVGSCTNDKAELDRLFSVDRCPLTIAWMGIALKEIEKSGPYQTLWYEDVVKGVLTYLNKLLFELDWTTGRSDRNFSQQDQVVVSAWIMAYVSVSSEHAPASVYQVRSKLLRVLDNVRSVEWETIGEARFGFECYAAFAFVKGLEILGKGNAVTRSFIREVKQWLVEWRKRSRATCNERTLVKDDIVTMTFLLEALLPKRRQRSLALLAESAENGDASNLRELAKLKWHGLNVGQSVYNISRKSV